MKPEIVGPVVSSTAIMATRLSSLFEGDAASTDLYRQEVFTNLISKNLLVLGYEQITLYLDCFLTVDFRKAVLRQILENGLPEGELHCYMARILEKFPDPVSKLHALDSMIPYIGGCNVTLLDLICTIGVIDAVWAKIKAYYRLKESLESAAYDFLEKDSRIVATIICTL